MVSVNVPPVPRMDLENWIWQTHEMQISGGDRPQAAASRRRITYRKGSRPASSTSSTSYKREKKLA